MKLALGCCLLVTLGLVSCGGTSGSATVSGTDPASIKAAPAGVSTLVFMDFELARPDNLTGDNTTWPTGVTPSGGLAPVIKGSPKPLLTPLGNPGGSGTLTFDSTCKAANGGTMTGTVGVSWIFNSQTVTTYTETFNLTVTPAKVNGVTPAQHWTYTGQQVITVTNVGNDNNAVLTIPSVNGLTATFTDNTVPSSPVVKTFTISSPALGTQNALSVSWTNPLGFVSLTGQYTITETVAAASVYAVTVSAGPSLIWDTTKSCNYPGSGTLTLDLTGSLGTDSTTVVFNATCGDMTIAGANFNLGQ